MMYLLAFYLLGVYVAFVTTVWVIEDIKLPIEGKGDVFTFFILFPMSSWALILILINQEIQMMKDNQ